MLPNPKRRPLRTLMGLGGLIGLGVFALAPPPEPPDVGRLEVVFAEPAETVEVHSLQSGESLGGVLSGFLDQVEQQSFLLAFREWASPRRMRVGTEITLRSRDEGGEGRLRGVEVVLSADETLRLTRNVVGWSSDLVETPVRTDTVYAAGGIEDVLWNAVVENEALQAIPVGDRALLMHHLDQVFQWQVDFSRQIQRGDQYRFAFERLVRPDGSMRAGHVLAAELVNAGTSYHAIWFDPDGDGEGTYYDLDGQSVRRAFLLRPLEFRRISSRFTNARFHPVLRTWRAHRGVDFAADAGTPIQATGDGVVIQRGRRGGLGNAVEIRHPNGFTTRYGHMSRFVRGVRLGTRVRQGDVIGYVGQTGLATGPHLHYEMHRRGQPVDPLAIDLPPGDPVPAGAWDRWQSALLARVALLDRVPGWRRVTAGRSKKIRTKGSRG